MFVQFICLHVKFVENNIQNQLLPSLDQDSISINQISNFTEKKGGVLHKKLIKHFYSQNHHDMHEDMIVQIIDHCVQTIKKSEKIFLEAQIKNTLHRRFKSKTNYLTRS